jgi:hypothetical protein
VNIDKPTKCYLHTDLCPSVSREATPLKGINEEKADGGWFSFDSKEEASVFLAKKFPDKSLFAHYCVDSHE